MRPLPVFDWRTWKTPRSNVAVCVLPPVTAVVSATWPLRVSTIAAGRAPRRRAASGHVVARARDLDEDMPFTGATTTECPESATGAPRVGAGVGIAA